MNPAILEQQLVFGAFWTSLLSFIFFIISVSTKKKNDEGKRISSMLGYFTMLLTTIVLIGALVSKAIASQHVPWSNFYESMILMGAVVGVMFIFLFHRYKQELFGIVMSPTIVILLGIANLLPESFKGNNPLVPALRSYWIKIHTTSMIVSYSVFMLATGSAIAYLIMYFIVNKKGGTPNKLSLASTGPNLSESNVKMVGTEEDSEKKSTNRLEHSTEDTSENHKNLIFFDELAYRLILFGLPILTFGIITGAVWANEAWGTYWSWDPKETASLMTMLFYTAYIHAKLNLNLKGKTSAILALVGFVAVVFTYYGVNYLPGLHSYGFSV